MSGIGRRALGLRGTDRLRVRLACPVAGARSFISPASAAQRPVWSDDPEGIRST